MVLGKFMPPHAGHVYLVELALLAWSMVHGLSTLWIQGAIFGPAGPDVTIESLAEAATEMLLRGIAR
mgnify:CR=1 FL=1